MATERKKYPTLVGAHVTKTMANRVAKETRRRARHNKKCDEGDQVEATQSAVVREALDLFLKRQELM